MNRRGFFKALAAATAIAVVSTTRLGQAVIDVARSGYHVLVGDGVTDDTAALQALIEGEEVFSASGVRLSGGYIPLAPSGKYLLTDTITLDDNSRVGIFGSVITCDIADENKPVFNFTGNALNLNVDIRGCRISRAGAGNIWSSRWTNV
jgi:urease gamma subunit